jgi:hypothetical protein
METRYLFEISRIELQENKQYGTNDLIIKQVKVMDKDGNYIKFAKINEALLTALKQAESVKIKK